MLDFDKMEVILTFNSTFLKINVETFNFLHEKIIISLSVQKIQLSACMFSSTECCPWQLLNFLFFEDQVLVPLKSLATAGEPSVWIWGCCGHTIFWLVFNATVCSCYRIWNIRSSGYFFFYIQHLWEAREACEHLHRISNVWSRIFLLLFFCLMQCNLLLACLILFCKVFL